MPHPIQVHAQAMRTNEDEVVVALTIENRSQNDVLVPFEVPNARDKVNIGFKPDGTAIIGLCQWPNPGFLVTRCSCPWVCLRPGENIRREFRLREPFEEWNPYLELLLDGNRTKDTGSTKLRGYDCIGGVAWVSYVVPGITTPLIPHRNGKFSLPESTTSYLQNFLEIPLEQLRGRVLRRKHLSRFERDFVGPPVSNPEVLGTNAPIELRSQARHTGNSIDVSWQVRNTADEETVFVFCERDAKLRNYMGASPCFSELHFNRIAMFRLYIPSIPMHVPMEEALAPLAVRLPAGDSYDGRWTIPTPVSLIRPYQEQEKRDDTRTLTAKGLIAGLAYLEEPKSPGGTPFNPKNESNGTKWSIKYDECVTRQQIVYSAIQPLTFQVGDN